MSFSDREIKKVSLIIPAHICTYYKNLAKTSPAHSETLSLHSPRGPLNKMNEVTSAEQIG